MTVSRFMGYKSLLSSQHIVSAPFQGMNMRNVPWLHERRISLYETRASKNS